MDEAKATVRALLDALNQKDWERYGELLAPDVEYTIMGYELPGAGTMDREATLKQLPAVLGLFADDSPRVEITQLIVEGSWVVAEAQGTGSFRDGTVYENRYSTTYEVVDGRIRTVREYMDTQHMANLLAAVTASAEDAR
ncbi:MAG TPA: nuclear transport factor 2 family protein [Streptomyces sp.]|uniref:nuclear transport factor 2 family protein n=1 Tax=Streptomyces sp. TaxID=1931 RepID=UPI002C22A3D0|nr:nuclear transport factor 2 family protein [Streptomyces sp.]HWU06174.1 nuclear transport factor 2 family protein [Streptomyces sp.]